MRCSEFLQRYSDLRDGVVLEPQVALELERHLRSCPRCARYDYAVSRGVGVLRLLSEVDPSPAFQRELQTRLALATRGLPRAAPMRTPAAIAAAALLAVAGALLLYEGMSARHERVLAEQERAIPLVIAHPGVPFVSFAAPEVTEEPVMAVPASAPMVDTAWGTAP
jgi:anti-sigma factor RsiW